MSGMPSRMIAAATAVLLGCACNDQSVGGDRQDAGAPPWNPPIVDLGDPGWQDSSVPWIPGPSSGEDVDAPLSVWSYEGGVFLLQGRRPWGEPTIDSWSVSLNDGTGWRTWFGPQSGEDGSAPGQIRGFPDGNPVLAGALFGPSSPVLGIVDDSVQQRTELDVGIVFVVHDTLAYGLAGAMPDYILQFDGVAWRPVDGLVGANPYSIWANDQVVFVACDDGVIYSKTAFAAEWELHDTGTTATVTSVWGFAGDDVWAATSDGELLHYDGQNWTRMPWPDPRASNNSNIVALWGHDGVLYFRARALLGRVKELDAEVIAYWGECSYGDTVGCTWRMDIVDMWGNAPDELFLVTVEETWPDQVLQRRSHVLYFDGTTFHDM